MIRWKVFGTTVFMLTVSIVFVFKINLRGVPVVLQTNLENFPMKLGKYQGHDGSFSLGVYEELKADLHVYRHYSVEGEEKIDLYIGYYGTAKGGRTGHNPYGCLPGAGWGIVENTTLIMKPSYIADGAFVNLVVARKANIYIIMLHWYQSAGTEILASGFQQNVHRFKKKLFYNRNDGAYMQISSFVEEKDASRAKEKIAEFTLAVLELLPQYWPEEGVKEK